LIPPEAAGELAGLKTENGIVAFADRVGISAGIVVGRMQWDKLLPYSQLNHLRRVMDEGFCALARQGCWCTWLSVTEAAELTHHDFPHVDLRPARAKVSEAAGRGAFATNGLKGQDRRCEPVSVDAWRLRQRDRDMQREEKAA
jgi:predicted NBD/HSP70 family sugar kinase